MLCILQQLKKKINSYSDLLCDDFSTGTSCNVHQISVLVGCVVTNQFGKFVLEELFEKLDIICFKHSLRKIQIYTILEGNILQQLVPILSIIQKHRFHNR